MAVKSPSERVRELLIPSAGEAAATAKQPLIAVAYTAAPALVTFCAVIGAYRLGRAAWVVADAFNRHVLRKPHDLYERYAIAGKDSWVVVTGGSDGIGLELCHDMARRGFNVCMIARNAQKMEEKLAEVSAECPDVKTKAVAFDFSKLTHFSDYEEIIGESLKGLDIAMLFCNAGYIRTGPFIGLKPYEIESSVTINALHPFYTTKVLIDQMANRAKRSAMVVTASGLAHLAVPGCTDYSATKSMASFLAEGLNYELQGRVDCMAWHNGKTATKMNGLVADGKVIDAEVAVAGMLRDLGYESLTYGHKAHAKSMFMVTNVFPVWKLKEVFYNGFKKEFEESGGDSTATARKLAEKGRQAKITTTYGWLNDSMVSTSSRPDPLTGK